MGAPNPASSTYRVCVRFPHVWKPNFKFNYCLKATCFKLGWFWHCIHSVFRLLNPLLVNFASTETTAELIWEGSLFSTPLLGHFFLSLLSIPGIYQVLYFISIMILLMLSFQFRLHPVWNNIFMVPLRNDTDQTKDGWRKMHMDLKLCWRSKANKPINISGMRKMSRVVWSDCVCIHQKSMQSFNPNVQSLWGTLAV